MALDLRPRIVLHPPGGAVVILVDPSSPLGGDVELPYVGRIPYTITPALPVSTVTLQVPFYGPVELPVEVMSLAGAGGGGPSTVTIPGIGEVPYDVVLGPPDLPEEALFQSGVQQAVMTWGSLALVGGIALLAFFRRR